MWSYLRAPSPSSRWTSQASCYHTQYVCVVSESFIDRPTGCSLSREDVDSSSVGPWCAEVPLLHTSRRGVQRPLYAPSWHFERAKASIVRRILPRGVYTIANLGPRVVAFLHQKELFRKSNSHSPHFAPAAGHRSLGRRVLSAR